MRGCKFLIFLALTMPCFAQSQDEKDLQELQQAQQKMVDQVTSLNQLNPMMPAAVGGGPAGGVASAQGDAGKIDPSKLPPALQWAGPLLTNQHVVAKSKSLAAVAAKPEFQSGMDAIMKNPNLKWMYVGFGVVSILFFLLKSRVLAATDRFLMRLALKFLLVPVYFGGMFGVAYGVLGQPFVQVLTLVAKGMIAG